MKIKLKLTVLMLRQSEKSQLTTHTYIHTDRQADRQAKKSWFVKNDFVALLRGPR